MIHFTICFLSFRIAVHAVSFILFFLNLSAQDQNGAVDHLKSRPLLLKYGIQTWHSLESIRALLLSRVIHIIHPAPF